MKKIRSTYRRSYASIQSLLFLTFQVLQLLIRLTLSVTYWLGPFKMAQLALAFVDPLIQAGTAIAGAITNSQQEKDFRNQWTPQAVDSLQQQNPTKNIMIVCSQHDASGLQGVERKNVECDCPTGAKIAYNAYIFDSGVFQLQGDGSVLCRRPATLLTCLVDF